MPNLTDTELLRLFRQRDQAALSGTQQKYGGLCRSIAKNILGSREDAEECLNDALLKLWESIPPEKPRSLAAYVSVVVRNLACNRRAAAHAQKRGGGEFAVALSEIEDTLAAPDHPETVLDTIAIGDALNRFLGGLPAETRVMFVLRYWSELSIREIAQRCGVGQSKVKMTLLRTRNDLKAFLEKEGLR
ncbi:MAG: RNA polymerase sigma factor [Oscillospiraceae bacterium]|nr:RNA polymerase sigma factor [Oscillospiraceae bacterium]